MQSKSSKNWAGSLVVLAALALALFLGAVLPVVAQDVEPEPAPMEVDRTDCIYGYAWFDGNHSGVWDENEDAMDGARVDLFAVGPFKFRPGNLWRASSLLTRDGGYYEFCGLAENTYFVQIAPPQGVLRDQLVMTYGSNPTAPVLFAEGDSLSVSFGMAPPRTWDSSATLPIPRR